MSPQRRLKQVLDSKWCQRLPIGPITLPNTRLKDTDILAAFRMTHNLGSILICSRSPFQIQAETGEIKGHYLNATAGTCEEMMKRAVFARELGAPIVMHDYLTGGFTANTSLAFYCRDNGLLLHIHRAMHAVIDRQKITPRHLFYQDWVSMRASSCSFGRYTRMAHAALTEIFGDDSVLQFGGGTLGHPWGNAPGAVANRVALEACVQARNEGRDLAREGNEIIREASKWSPELAAACEIWKAIKFEFDTIDTL
ncbi:hypothetical protein L7F22_046788 [Adiantum nelumboides]|nr:hypothetical protein [Adiantum nelumboides]